MGSVYISRDAIFYETVFPFSSLHANAGAQLKSEILLLRRTLRNNHGGDGVDLPNMTNSVDGFVQSHAGPSRNPEVSDTGEQMSMERSTAANPGVNPGGDTPALVASDQACIRSVLDSMEIVVSSDSVPAPVLWQLGGSGSFVALAESNQCSYRNLEFWLQQILWLLHMF
jgi:hypothetical protein